MKESDESLNVQGISHKKLRFADEPLPSQAQEENLVLSDVLDAEANSPVECAKLIFESCPNILKEIEKLMLSKIKEKLTVCAHAKMEIPFFSKRISNPLQLWNLTQSSKNFQKNFHLLVRF